MLFNSWIFVVFLAVVLGMYYALGPTKFRIGWLLATSYFFYGWLNPFYLVLLAYATLASYGITRLMAGSFRPKGWLSLGVANGLVLLGFFKYGVFVVDNLNWLFVRWGIPLTLRKPGTLFPVGISFYTLLIIGYMVDVYRGKIPPEKNLIRYAAFTSFFPYLLSGPIERAGNMLPQLTAAPRFSITNITEGSSVFVVGLFKKIALADFLAVYVAGVYGDPGHFAGLPLLLATYAFAWQIYFDFSGYTDMARGAAKMFGINLMLNFKNPYLSTGLGDFWRRWHISLSSWIRDYIYFPLAGRTIAANTRSYLAMIVAILLAGLWHGAAWTFVIWGVLHALGRAFTRELEMTGFYKDRIPKVVKQVVIFHWVCLSWVFFRADTVKDAMTVLAGIFSFTAGDPRLSLAAILFVFSVWIYQFLIESRYRRFLESSTARVALMLAMILYMVFFNTGGYEKFYYFRF